MVHMLDSIYVFELKYDGSTEDALLQIDNKGYLIPYSAEGKRLDKIGINCNSKQRAIDNWLIKEV